MHFNLLHKMTFGYIAALVLIMLPSLSFAVTYQNFKAYDEFGITESQVKKALDESKRKHNLDLDEMARDMTQFYRNSGLSFHQVVKVKGGLLLHEGVLKNIFVHDPKWKTVIDKQLDPLKDKVIFDARLQKYLLSINNWPGFEIFSFFSVADDQGGVNLNVMLKNKKHALLSASIDNYGQTSTGKNQYSVSAQTYNLLLKPSHVTLNVRGTDVVGNEGLSLQYNKILSDTVNISSSVNYQQIQFDYDLGEGFSKFIVEGQKISVRSQFSKQINSTALSNNLSNTWLSISKNEMSGSSDQFENITISGIDQDNLYINAGSNYLSNNLFSNQKTSWRQNYSVGLGYLIDQLNEEESNLLSMKLATKQQIRHSLIGPTYQKMDLLLNVQAQLVNKKAHSNEKMTLTGQGAMAQWEPSLVSSNNAVIADLKLLIWQFSNKSISANSYAQYQYAYGETPDVDAVNLQGASIGALISYKDFAINADYHHPLDAPDGFDMSSMFNFKVSYQYDF